MVLTKIYNHRVVLDQDLETLDEDEEEGLTCSWWMMREGWCCGGNKQRRRPSSAERDRRRRRGQAGTAEERRSRARTTEGRSGGGRGSPRVRRAVASGKSHPDPSVGAVLPQGNDGVGGRCPPRVGFQKAQNDAPGPKSVWAGCPGKRWVSLRGIGLPNQPLSLQQHRSRRQYS